MKKNYNTDICNKSSLSNLTTNPYIIKSKSTMPAEIATVTPMDLFCDGHFWHFVPPVAVWYPSAHKPQRGPLYKHKHNYKHKHKT